jgi:phage tail-like protein
MSRTLAALSFASLLVLSTSAFAQSQRAPLTSFTFGLKITGNNSPLSGGTAFFKSVGGLSSETEVVDFREGGVNGTTKKIAGTTHFQNITLKRTLNSDPSLAVWRKIVEGGNYQQAQRTAVLIAYDNSNKEVARWTLNNAWPSKISIETDEVTGDAMEVLTLAVDAVTRP